MEKFSISEINLVCIFIGDTKAETIANIMDGIPNFYDKELVGIAEQSVNKLDTLTEAEFEDMDFKERFTD